VQSQATGHRYDILSIPDHNHRQRG
jgi:hypothetical protein